MNVSLGVYLCFALLTLVIEAPLVGVLLRRRCGWARSLLLGLVPSAVTHPLLWFVWPHAVDPQRHYWAYVATGESLVVLIEAGLIGWLARPLTGPPSGSSYRVRLGIVVSVLANFVSWGVGMLMHQLGVLWPFVAVVSGWFRALVWI